MRKSLVLALAIGASLIAIQLAHAVSFCLETGEKATYTPGGRYTYEEPARGVTWNGTWTGSPKVGGAVQVTFPNGRRRNDSFVTSDGRVYLVNAGGRRFPGRVC